MKHYKVHILGMIVTSLTIVILILPIYASKANDVRNTLTVTPSPSSVKAGTNVTIEFELKNVGTNTVSPSGLLYIWLPPELDFVNFSSNVNGETMCSELVRFSDTDDTKVHSKYKFYTSVICYTLSIDNLLPPLEKDKTHILSVNAIANNSFTKDVTSIFGLNAPSPQEDESSFVESADWDGDPYSLDSNNVATYTFTPSFSTTTQLSTTTSTLGDEASTANNQNESSTGETSLDLIESEEIPTEVQSEFAFNNEVPERAELTSETEQEVSSGHNARLILSGLLFLVFILLLISFFKKRRNLINQDHHEFKKALSLN